MKLSGVGAFHTMENVRGSTISRRENRCLWVVSPRGAVTGSALAMEDRLAELREEQKAYAKHTCALPVTDVGRVLAFFRCSLRSSLDTALSGFCSSGFCASCWVVGLCRDPVLPMLTWVDIKAGGCDIRTCWPPALLPLSCRASLVPSPGWQIPFPSPSQKTPVFVGHYYEPHQGFLTSST